MLELLLPSGMTTALLGILVDGGGGLTLEILVMLGFAGLASAGATVVMLLLAAGCLLTTVFTFPIYKRRVKGNR